MSRKTLFVAALIALLTACAPRPGAPQPNTIAAQRATQAPIATNVIHPDELALVHLDEPEDLAQPDGALAHAAPYGVWAVLQIFCALIGSLMRTTARRTVFALLTFGVTALAALYAMLSGGAIVDWLGFGISALLTLIVGGVMYRRPWVTRLTSKTRGAALRALDAIEPQDPQVNHG